MSIRFDEKIGVEAGCCIKAFAHFGKHFWISFNQNAVSSRVLGSDSCTSTACECVQNYVAWIGTQLDKVF